MLLIFIDDYFVCYITAVPIGGSYSLVIRTPLPPSSSVDQCNNVILTYLLHGAASFLRS